MVENGGTEDALQYLLTIAMKTIKASISIISTINFVEMKIRPQTCAIQKTQFMTDNMYACISYGGMDLQ